MFHTNTAIGERMPHGRMLKVFLGTAVLLVALAMLLAPHFAGRAQAITTNTEVYSTAGTFSYVVPSNVDSITVKLWGGGAGGGGTDTGIGGPGGGGAFAQKTLSVDAGETYTIVVGGGGAGGRGCVAGTGGGAGGSDTGGSGGNAGVFGCSGGGVGGGGRSEIALALDATVYAVAGGGGGGGGGGNVGSNKIGGAGGAGGVNGSSAGGLGGTAGGSGTSSGTAGGDVVSGDGGGGGGDNGGTGGGAGLSDTGGGGAGGGSSSGDTFTNGSGVDAGNNADTDYEGSAGAGGAAGSIVNPSTAPGGNPGLVVIIEDVNATVSINDVSVAEGGNLEFTVSLSSAESEDVVITYSTADGTATTADNDYTSQSNQSLTIPAGQTSGTITIATTADSVFESDETLDVNLTGVLVGAGSTVSSTIFWTDWLSSTGSTTAGGTGTFVALGEIITGTTTVDVTYTNPLGVHFFLTGAGGEIDYWRQGFLGILGRDPATSPYTSTVVENIPFGTDLIALKNAGSQTLTFSEVIANPVFSYVSLNGNGYGFDQDFEILSFADGTDNDCGYHGCGTASRNEFTLPDGSTQFQLLGAGENSGTIRFLGAFDTVTWESLQSETWNDFTVGVQGTVDEVYELEITDGTGQGTILNDDAPPTLTTFGPVTFTEGDSPVIVDPILTLTGTDNIGEAKVSFGAGFIAAEDTLDIDDSLLPAGLTSSYNSDSGVLTISGVASPADYQAALRLVTYSNDSSDPNATDREVTFSIVSVLGTVTVHVVPLGGSCLPGATTAIELIDDLKCDVDALVMQNGINTALKAKLDGARASLIKGNDKAAINKLNAFVNFVSTRIGKQFNHTQADHLIGAAEAIICKIDPTQPNCPTT